MLARMRRIHWDTFLAGFGAGLGFALIITERGRAVEDVLYLVALVTLGVAGALRARRQAKTVEAPPVPVPPIAP
jgi:hypothetical protein